MTTLLRRYTVFDLIIIALMASLGIALKPLVVPLAHILTGPLYIPGGVVAGGFYMMWIVLGAGIVGKLGSATLIAVVQTIVVISLGVYGTHGIMSFITYMIPGLAIDLVWFLFRHRGCCLGCLFVGGIVANVSGSLSVNLVFFRLPWVPLLLSLSIAALSGGLGGIVAFQLLTKIRRAGFATPQMGGDYD